MSISASRIPASIVSDTQASMNRFLDNKRGAIAVNAILHVMRETDRTQMTCTDYQAVANIHEILRVLASDVVPDETERKVPAGSHPDEVAGPVKPRLAAVQETLSAPMQAAE